MAPWIVGKWLSGNRIFLPQQTAFRLDRLRPRSCFGMPGFLAGPRGKTGWPAGTRGGWPLFPVGRII